MLIQLSTSLRIAIQLEYEYNSHRVAYICPRIFVESLDAIEKSLEGGSEARRVCRPIDDLLLNHSCPEVTAVCRDRRPVSS